MARRDKKALLIKQCKKKKKKIEENNRMEKTRDLFKKIRDTKETFHDVCKSNHYSVFLKLIQCWMSIINNYK